MAFSPQSLSGGAVALLPAVGSPSSRLARPPDPAPDAEPPGADASPGPRAHPETRAWTRTLHPGSDRGLLRIVRRVDARGVTLLLHGELDLASASALEHELGEAERQRPARIVLDLAALDFVDSTGVHLLIEAQLRADRAGHRLVLTSVPAHADRLFRLTGIAARLTIE